VTCRWTGCSRAPIPTGPAGIAHAHCADHERRLLAEAFGPVAWQDRAITNTLPPLVVGGIRVTTARSALEPRVPTPLAPLVPSAERAAVAAPTG
jgi:hypothetical protein